PDRVALLELPRRRAVRPRLFLTAGHDRLPEAAAAQPGGPPRPARELRAKSERQAMRRCGARISVSEDHRVAFDPHRAGPLRLQGVDMECPRVLTVDDLRGLPRLARLEYLGFIAAAFIGPGRASVVARGTSNEIQIYTP